MTGVQTCALPISKDGREEYVREQRALTATASGVRARLFGEYAKLAAAVACGGAENPHPVPTTPS